MSSNKLQIEPFAYESSYVFEALGIKKNDYATFGRVCRELGLPRFKRGKKLLFPKKELDARLETIKRKGMREYGFR